MTEVVSIPPPAIDLAAVKTRQRAAWSTGNYAVVGTTLQIVGENLCEALDLRAGSRVLDVAAGNGNASLAAARRWCDVTSTDYVAPLLEAGQRRAQAEGHTIHFEEADAEDLPFADGSFDAVMSTFGVMFTPNQEQAASELTRVCRPGGRIGLANWTPESFIGQLFKTIGKYIPPAPGVKSPALWGTPARLQELFGRTAREIRTPRRDFVFRYRSPAHWIEVFRTFYGPLNKTFWALDAEKQVAFTADLQALMASRNRAHDGTLVLPSEYLEVVIGGREPFYVKSKYAGRPCARTALRGASLVSTAGQRRKPQAPGTARGNDSADAPHALLDADSPLPLWAPIAQVLRRRIAQHGPALTGLTDQALAGEFGVSPLTVRQALQELVRSGLVTRHRGKGTFVVSFPVHGSVDHLDTAMSEWRVQGQGVRIEILERSRLAASIPTAAALQVKPGQMVGYLHRLRHADGHPVGVDYRYIVAEIDDRLDDTDVEHETMWEVLENKLGVFDIRANVTIRATAASAQEASLLRIAAGAPVLDRGFHLVTAAGRPLLVGHSVYHPDRFIHATTVRRSRG